MSGWINDDVAAEQERLEQLDNKIPETLVLVGGNDIHDTEYTSWPKNTFDEVVEEMTRRAANQRVGQPAREVLEVVIVRRTLVQVDVTVVEEKL